MEWWTDPGDGPAAVRLAHAVVGVRQRCQCAQWARDDFPANAWRTQSVPTVLRCRMCAERTTGMPGAAVVWRPVEDHPLAHAYAGGEFSACGGQPAILAGSRTTAASGRCPECVDALQADHDEEASKDVFEIPKRTRCGCGTEIMFMKTGARRVMPVDSEPHPAGSVRIDWRGMRATAHVMSTAEIHTHHGRRYIPHMTACRITEQYRQTYRQSLSGHEQKASTSRAERDARTVRKEPMS
jgi:hypothetical protein